MFDVKIVFIKLFLLRSWIHNTYTCGVAVTGLEIEMNENTRRLFLFQFIETAKNGTKITPKIGFKWNTE